MIAARTVPPLERLLEAVDGRSPGSGVHGEVVKIDITGKGEMVCELALGTEHRWYAWKDDHLRELEIAADRRIPLAGRMKDDAFGATATPLSYRPGRRLTLLDRSGHKPRILKGFRTGHLKKMIANYEAAHAGFAGRGVHTPDIIEYDTANECLVMVFQAGERLKLSADTAELFHLIGVGLRDFQEHDFLPVGCSFRSGDELMVIDKRAARLRAASGRLPERWQALRDSLDAAGASLPPPFFGLAHRDLHDKQLIHQAHYLTLLDFDLMSRADVTLDPANFLAHLVLRNLQGTQGVSQRSIDVCGKKLLQGLGRNEEPGFWERLRYYQATTFCRLALVYSLRPRWSHLVPDLVTMGNRCLNDLLRIRGGR